MPVKIKTNFQGVRYYEHPTRKHGVQKDKYFTIRFKLQGKDKEEGLGWATKGWTAAKAYDRLKELKENHRTGTGVQTLSEKREAEQERRDQEEKTRIKAEQEAITLTAFFNDAYLPIAKADKKPKSVIREIGLFNDYIKPIIGNLPMKDISAFHLERLKKDMAGKEQSPRSIEYALAVIRQIFNAAKRLKIFTGENPTASVKFPKPDNARMRFLTHEEAGRLLTALKTRSIETHDMTLLSLHCGLRQGEIISLQWADVDLAKGTLTIRDAKAGSRFAFMTEQVKEMLQGREKGKPSDFVFPGRTGKMNRISFTFRRVVEELKLNEGITDPRQKVCFHTCRHSYASWLVESGQDLYIVQKLLGHKTNQMTMRYSHVGENQFRQAVNSLEKSMNKPEAGQVVNFIK